MESNRQREGLSGLVFILRYFRAGDTREKEKHSSLQFIAPMQLAARMIAVRRPRESGKRVEEGDVERMSSERSVFPQNNFGKNAWW